MSDDRYGAWEDDRWAEDARDARWDRAEEQERAADQRAERLTRDLGETGLSPAPPVEKPSLSRSGG